MVTYHFEQDKNLNGGNWGAGLEYRFNTVASVTAGRFYNSNRDYSNQFILICNTEDHISG